MIVATAVLAVVCLYLVLAGYADRKHIESIFTDLLNEERKRNASLLNRIQAGSLGEYVGAENALTEDPYATPEPDGWLSDDTGLITDPYWRDDRSA